MTLTGKLSREEMLFFCFFLNFKQFNVVAAVMSDGSDLKLLV